MSKLTNNLTSALLYVGVDVSKLTLSVSYCKDGKKDWYHTTIANTDAGIRAFLLELSALKSLAEVQFVLEFTGTYSTRLVDVLTDLDVKMSVITPEQSSAFAKVLKDDIKTDGRDARRLVVYGARMTPALYVPRSAENEDLKQLLVLLEQYNKQIRAKKNQLEALIQRPRPSEFIQRALETDIEHLETQKAAVEAELQQNSGGFEDKKALLTTIKGVGEVVATNVLIQTGCMESFTDVKQVIKFAGLAPNKRDSGTSVNKKGMIRGGNGSLRKILFLASWSAYRYNPDCKALYDRLRAKGKPKMVALIAVAAKILRQIWGILKSNTPFDSEFNRPKIAN